MPRANTGKWNRDGLEEVAEKPLARAPKSRVCYICGRLYMPHSFSIHEPQCRKLFLDREALKPPKERKPCPEDPVSMMRAHAGGGGGSLKSGMSFAADAGATAMHGGSRSSQRPSGGFSLDEINAASQAAYSEAALSKCRFCDRTMLPEKLSMHNKLCTRERPARRVGEGVKVDRTIVRAAATAANEPPRVRALKRLPVPVAAARAQAGTRIRAQEIDTSNSGAGVVHTSWRSKSNAFRVALKQARRVTRAEQLSKETGLSVASFLVPPTAEEQWLMDQANAGGDMIECANCLRSFSKKAGERHIPLCKSIMNKPSRLVRGSGKMGMSSGGNGVPGLLSVASKTHSPLAMRSSALGPTAIVQKPVWGTADSGIAVLEKPRLGRKQRQHPSPPVTPPANSAEGPHPYGFSKRPGSNGVPSAAALGTGVGVGVDTGRQSTAERVAQERVRARDAFIMRSGTAGASVKMATAHGDLLHKLMATKKSVNTALSGSGGLSKRGNGVVR